MIKQINYIDKIGIELEGGWRKKPERADLECHDDGSVHIEPCICGARENGKTCPRTNCLTYINEVVSKPLDNLEVALEWLKKTYPDKSNKTCGMHFHISTIDKLSYMRLMTQAFYKYFIIEVTKWGEEHKINEGTIFWERLTGQIHFCKNDFKPEAQFKAKRKGESDRYTHLNFAWGTHKTVECRLFPAFQKPALSFSALETYVNIVNSFLNKKSTEKAFKMELNEDLSENSELNMLVGSKIICV